MNLNHCVHLLTFSIGALLPVVRSLGAIGLRTVVLGGKPDAVASRSRHVADWIEVAGSGSPASTLRHVMELGRRVGRAVLLPNDEAAVEFVARHRHLLIESWDLAPVPELEAFLLATAKIRFSDLLEELRVPAPRRIVIRGNAPDAVPALSKLGFPLVLKPARGGYGLGVKQCRNASELEQAIRELPDREAPLLGQEFVNGIDTCLSVLAIEGRIIASTAQRALIRSERFGAPAQEILLEPCPALLDSVRAIVERLVWSGVAHFDAVSDPAGGPPLLLECNGRFWGSLLASTASGVNFPALAVRIARGESVTCPGSSRLRFHSAGLGLRRWLLPGNLPRLRWNETMLPYSFRDPLPEFLGWCGNKAGRSG